MRVDKRNNGPRQSFVERPGKAMRLTKQELLNTIVVLVDALDWHTGGEHSECYLGDVLESYMEQAIDTDLGHISEHSKRIVDEVLESRNWKI